MRQFLPALVIAGSAAQFAAAQSVADYLKCTGAIFDEIEFPNCGSGAKTSIDCFCKDPAAIKDLDKAVTAGCSAAKITTDDVIKYICKDKSSDETVSPRRGSQPMIPAENRKVLYHEDDTDDEDDDFDWDDFFPDRRRAYAPPPRKAETPENDSSASKGVEPEADASKLSSDPAEAEYGPDLGDGNDADNESGDDSPFSSPSFPFVDATVPKADSVSTEQNGNNAFSSAIVHTIVVSTAGPTPSSSSVAQLFAFAKPTSAAVAPSGSSPAFAFSHGPATVQSSAAAAAAAASSSAATPVFKSNNFALLHGQASSAAAASSSAVASSSATPAFRLNNFALHASGSSAAAAAASSSAAFRSGFASIPVDAGSEEYKSAHADALHALPSGSTAVYKIVTETRTTCSCAETDGPDGLSAQQHNHEPYRVESSSAVVAEAPSSRVFGSYVAATPFASASRVFGSYVAATPFASSTPLPSGADPLHRAKQSKDPFAVFEGAAAHSASMSGSVVLALAAFMAVLVML